MVFFDFLIGGGVGGIDRLGLFEFSERELQIALLSAFSPCSRWNWPSSIAHLGGAELVFGVGRVGAEGALVVDQRGVVVLEGFGLAAQLQIPDWPWGSRSGRSAAIAKSWQVRYAAQKTFPPRNLWKR